MTFLNLVLLVLWIGFTTPVSALFGREKCVNRRCDHFWACECSGRSPQAGKQINLCC